jgi:hypothetical protein
MRNELANDSCNLGENECRASNRVNRGSYDVRGVIVEASKA